jgi:hypothetical protein
MIYETVLIGTRARVNNPPVNAIDDRTCDEFFDLVQEIAGTRQ